MTFKELPAGAIFKTNFCHGVYMKTIPKRIHTTQTHTVEINATQLDTGHLAYLHESSPIIAMHRSFAEMQVDVVLEYIRKQE
jgi:hypothetical protein